MAADGAAVGAVVAADVAGVDDDESANNIVVVI